MYQRQRAQQSTGTKTKDARGPNDTTEAVRLRGAHVNLCTSKPGDASSSPAPTRQEENWLHSRETRKTA